MFDLLLEGSGKRTCFAAHFLQVMRKYHSPGASEKEKMDKGEASYSALTISEWN
jgi:hypothetical protein